MLTRPQRVIFDKVKTFVLDNRKGLSAQYRSGVLSMPNTFPARERKFISKLVEDLHLSVTWDEYNVEDQNLVTWRFPGALEELLPDSEEIHTTNGDAEGQEEWEDVEGDDDEEESEDEESNAAVDRVFKMYGKAQVVDDDEGGVFDARYGRSVEDGIL